MFMGLVGSEMCIRDSSLTKTDELQKVLAQIEALMSREESKTLSKKK